MGEFFSVLQPRYFTSDHSFENFARGFSVSKKQEIAIGFTFLVEGPLELQRKTVKKTIKIRPSSNW
jgi:hypothetical protein